MQLNDYVYWLDTNLPPKAVEWLNDRFNIAVRHVHHLNLLSSSDNEIFRKAKSSELNVVIITKDEDFVDLVLRMKPPPKIIWLTVGNVTNLHLKKILLDNLSEAVDRLSIPDNYYVEIG